MNITIVIIIVTVLVLITVIVCNISNSNSNKPIDTTVTKKSRSDTSHKNCCQSLDPFCMACTRGLTVQEYCELPEAYGCDKYKNTEK